VFRAAITSIYVVAFAITVEVREEWQEMNDTGDVAGVDGCAAGWIVATSNDVVVLPNLRVEQFGLVGVDMPIGLLDGPPRACDVAARKYLGPARSSVFPAPPRAALACTDYTSALAVARAATGRGISKQTYNIMQKVAELDDLIAINHVASKRECDLIEVHPECTFKMLNDDCNLPSKKSIDGKLMRRRLLTEHFDIPLHAPKGASIDDLLDAYAVLWSAQRFRRGEHRVFGDGQRDSRGIEMRIVC
jgi:predicted RNase H-like nuclease